MRHAGQRELTFHNPQAGQAPADRSTRSDILIAIFALPLLFTVFNFCTRPITDGDIWFHLSYGKYIIRHHTLVVDHQAFTWTPAIKDVPYGTWLAQLCLYMIYQAGGLTLLFVFRYAVFIVYLFILIRYASKRMIIRLPLTWLVIILSLIIALCSTNIKPNLFSVIFMTALVFFWFQLKTASGREYSRCYILPVLMLIWVNTHGVWIFGYTYLCCILIGEVLNIFTSPDKTLNPVIQKHFLIAYVLCSAAIFATPHGWRYPAYVLNEILNKPEIQSHLNVIMEYQSLFDIMDINAGARRESISYLLYLLISFFIIGVFIRPQLKRHAPDWTIILPVVLFAGLYLTFIRTMFLYAPVFAFSALYLISTYRSPLILSAKTWEVAHIGSAILYVGLLTYVNIMNLERFSGLWFGVGTLSPLPAEESEFIKEHFSGTDIGNDYDSGSYLSWILWPQIKTMIDARYFPFKDWYEQYLKFIDGVEVKAFLQKYPCDLWCLQLDSGVIPYFVKSSEWNLIFYGPSCCIFLRSGSQLLDFPRMVVARSVASIKDHRQFKKIFDFTLLIKDYDTAQFLIENTKSIQENPKLKSKFYAILGRSAYDKTNMDNALKFCLKAIEAYPNNIYALMTAGICYNSKGDLLTAEKCFRRVLDIDPGSPDARRLLNNIKKIREQIDKEIISIENNIKTDPEEADLYYKLGTLYEMQGNPMLAMKEYDNALALKPDHVDSLYKLAFICVQKKEYHRAIQYFKIIIECRPELTSVYYNIGCLYAKTGGVQEAVVWLKSAIDKGYDDWDMIKKDTDLDMIRGLPEYQALLKNEGGKSFED